MAESSYPFDTQTVSENQWSALMRLARPSGVVAEDTDRLAVTPGTGLEVEVGLGQAVVRGHFYEVTSGPVTLTVGANLSGNPRIDRVCLRLDPAANSVTAVVLAGTPAASPVAPAMTKTDSAVYELSLATVYVADGAGTLTAGNVTDAREYPQVLESPAGLVAPFAGSTAPVGWLVCNGATVSTVTYPRLFAVIGHTYGGAGDTFRVPDLQGRMVAGFKSADADFNTLGETGGVKDVTLTSGQLPTHSHAMAHTHPMAHTHSIAHIHGGSTVTAGGHTHNNYMSHRSIYGSGSNQAMFHPGVEGDVPTTLAGAHSHAILTAGASPDVSGASSAANTGASSSGLTGGSGGGGSHENMPPYLVQQYVIKAW